MYGPAGSWNDLRRFVLSSLAPVGRMTASGASRSLPRVAAKGPFDRSGSEHSAREAGTGPDALERPLSVSTCNCRSIQ